MREFRTRWYWLAILVLAACRSEEGRGPGTAMRYPETQRGETADDYFGTTVADPYRWLERTDAPTTDAWIDAQNAISEPFLESIPARQRYIDRLTKLWNHERFGLPVERGGRYFWTRNDGLQNQAVLYVADRLDGNARILLDPNGLSDDGTKALSSWIPSSDGRHLAFGISDGGSDWNEWRVLVVATGEQLPDRIGRMKFSGVSWDASGQGFYYSRYPIGADGRGNDQLPVTIHHHTLGQSQEQDPLVCDLKHPTRNPYGSVTDDGRYLIVTLFDGYQTNAVHYQDLATTGAGVVPLLDAWDARYGFLGNVGSRFYFETTLGAPRKRIVEVDVAKDRTPKEVVPQSEHVLEGASLVGGRLIATYLEHARSSVRIFRLDGTLERDFALPGIGSASGFGGRVDAKETFYAFTSYTTPGAIYHYEFESGRTQLFRAPKVDGFDPEAYETRQVFYSSKDGTQVPMFLVHKKGLTLDGRRPTVLYGYGGFDVSLTPAFSVAQVAWMESGGVYAVANLRGGGEYGEAWHLAGTKLRKQNVFDDFIAAAEWLIAQGYTTPARLATLGGSNGGLLVAACLLQRPDLFGACLPAVGVLDMLRYHTQSANARQWSSDYGLSEDPEQFRALFAYSPLHNLRPGTCYPPTLITTGKGDDRVAPWHSYKFAAALQAAQGCSNPILIRVETRAGHGAGKPTWMRIEEIADEWAFLHHCLHMDQP